MIKLLEEPAYIAEAKLLRVFMVLNCIAERPRTANFIAEYADISQRTAYRYLHLINAIGFEVLQTGGYFKLGSKRPRFIEAIK